MDAKELSIHDRLELIEGVINAGTGVAGGIAGLVDILHKHVPTPATVNPGETLSDDVLSRTAFTSAMVQQAKDFGVAIEDCRSRLNDLETMTKEIVSTLERLATTAPQPGA